jgi:SSS family solute:Na+ symporter
MSAYFSAIMSTADSCLMASSGNVLTDIIQRLTKLPEGKRMLHLSQLLTLVIGFLALLLATTMQNVLELMLYSYAFMVSGLFVPILAALYTRKPNHAAAFAAMLLGGGTTITLIVGNWNLPLGLDANIFGISVSALSYLAVSQISPQKKVHTQ